MVGNEEFGKPFLLRNYTSTLYLILRAMIIIYFRDSEVGKIVLVQILVMNNIHLLTHSEEMSIYAIVMCIIKR